jgi:hypothetical protein
MKPRLNPFATAPQLLQALLDLNQKVMTVDSKRA